MNSQNTMSIFIGMGAKDRTVYFLYGSRTKARVVFTMKSESRKSDRNQAAMGANARVCLQYCQ